MSPLEGPFERRAEPRPDLTTSQDDQVELTEAAAPTYVLSLYVAGDTAKARDAIASLTRLCQEQLLGRYTFATQVIDLLESPELAAIADIVALPTLVREQPAPSKRIIGDLSNTARVLAALGIQARPAKIPVLAAANGEPVPPGGEVTAAEHFVQNSRASRLGGPMWSRYRIR